MVSLASGNPGMATVPVSVTVPEGVSSTDFQVSTVVGTSGTVVISGSQGGVTRSAELTVTPAPATTLSAVSLSPTSVRGGNSSTGTVTLSAAAPAGGTVVTLSSSAAVATVASSVTVGAGFRSAKFTVSTSRVTSSTQVTISAALGGQSTSAQLAVTRK
jgi:hypothetical protein